MNRKIGIIFGMENTFPPALVENETGACACIFKVWSSVVSQTLTVCPAADWAQAIASGKARMRRELVGPFIFMSQAIDPEPIGTRNATSKTLRARE